MVNLQLICNTKSLIYNTQELALHLLPFWELHTQKGRWKRKIREQKKKLVLDKWYNLSCSWLCNGFINRQVILSSTQIHWSHVHGRMNRLSWHVIWMAFPYCFGSSFYGDCILYLLQNFRNRWPHVTVRLNAHQCFLCYFPHWLQVIVTSQRGINYTLYISTLYVQFCLFYNSYKHELYRFRKNTWSKLLCPQKKSEIRTHPLDYVSAISTKAFIWYCLLTGYEFKKNDTKTINITLVSQLLGNVVPVQEWF